MLMLCFWRYRSRVFGPAGLTATYSLTAIDNSARRQASWVDREFLGQVRELATRLTRRGRDAYLTAFLEATEDGELFSPYSLADHTRVEGGMGGGGPFRIGIGGCELMSSDTGGDLRARVMDDGLRLDLTLSRPAAGFPMGRDGSFQLAGKRMWGRTEPRVPAGGKLEWDCETYDLAGAVWFDHQWGNWSFPTPRRHLYHPEWLYYAAVLDDGRSLVVYRDKRAKGNRPEQRTAYALVHGRDGGCRHLTDLSIEVHGRLESLRTNNTYDFGWTMILPELDAALSFEPFHPNQEIAVFTRQRGLMETGCWVRGHIGAEPCQGWGFVEAFGDLLDINEYFWGQRKTNLALQLERFLPRTYDDAWVQRICRAAEPLQADSAAVEQAILGPLWSMMDRGGKGWRSAWLTTCYHAFGGKGLDEQVRELLPIAELLHTGSLIIDDFQDGATTRRSRPALHLEVGEDIAVNAGCFCYFLPFLILEELRGISAAQRAGMYGVITNALRQGHLGQAADLMWSKGRYDVVEKTAAFETTRSQLIEQYRLKSGCQLEAIARVAGILADAPADQVDAAAGYSRAFGVAFQILDDLIGLNVGEDRLGKMAGEDVRNGKLNMVLLYALHDLDPARRQRAARRMFQGRKGTGLQAARALIRSTGAAAHCLDLVEEIMDDASQWLRRLPRTDARLVMQSVPRWLLDQQRTAWRARPLVR
jgi:geranylgeranyl diphosphate synthase type I